MTAFQAACAIIGFAVGCIILTIFALWPRPQEKRKIFSFDPNEMDIDMTCEICGEDFVEYKPDHYRCPNVYGENPARHNGVKK